MKKILVLEPGAWGTALGIILSKKNKVSFWYEDSSLAKRIRRLRENEKLSGVRIPNGISVSANIRQSIKGADLIIVASSSFNFRKTLDKLAQFKNLPPLLGIAKGIEKETLKISSQIVEEVLGKVPYLHLSGPGFAKEIAEGKEVKEVIAAKDEDLLEFAKKIFRAKQLKIFTTTDLVGIQLAGAYKNTLSIGISLAEANCDNSENSDLRENLIRMGVEEMVKLGEAMGSKKETFWGPAGLGDLILTSGSTLSRNYQFGRAIFSDGDRIRKEIKEGKITVEGFNNAFAFQKLSAIHKVRLPIVSEVYNVIYKRVSPARTVRNLIKLTQRYRGKFYEIKKRQSIILES